jgi:hypothetical protein
LPLSAAVRFGRRRIVTAIGGGGTLPATIASAASTALPP